MWNLSPCFLLSHHFVSFEWVSETAFHDAVWESHMFHHNHPLQCRKNVWELIRIQISECRHIYYNKPETGPLCSLLACTQRSSGVTPFLSGKYLAPLSSRIWAVSLWPWLWEYHSKHMPYTNITTQVTTAVTLKISPQEKWVNTEWCGCLITSGKWKIISFNKAFWLYVDYISY